MLTDTDCTHCLLNVTRTENIRVCRQINLIWFQNEFYLKWHENDFTIWWGLHNNCKPKRMNEKSIACRSDWWPVISLDCYISSFYFRRGRHTSRQNLFHFKVMMIKIVNRSEKTRTKKRTSHVRYWVVFFESA